MPRRRPTLCDTLVNLTFMTLSTATAFWYFGAQKEALPETVTTTIKPLLTAAFALSWYITVRQYQGNAHERRNRQPHYNNLCEVLTELTSFTLTSATAFWVLNSQKDTLPEAFTTIVKPFVTATFAVSWYITIERYQRDARRNIALALEHEA